MGKVKLTAGPIGSFAHCGDRVTSSLSPKNSGELLGNRSVEDMRGGATFQKSAPNFWNQKLQASSDCETEKSAVTQALN
jgi:hypothetical protein